MKNFMWGWVLFICTLPAIAQETVTNWDPDRAYREGLDLFDRKDYVNARDVFSTVLDRTRSATDADIQAIRVNSEYYRALSALILQNPDGEHLMLAFLNNHAGNAKTNRAYFYLGDYYYRKKKYREVVEYLEKVDPFELDRSEAEDYRFQLGYGYFFKRDFAKARRYFQESKRSSKYAIPAHYYHGFIAFTEGDYEQALRDFREVEASAYFGKVVPFYITSIYFQQGQYKEVIDYATPLIEDRTLKYYPEVNQLLGKAYFERQEYEKALPLLLYYAESTRRMSKEDIFQLGFTQHKVGEYYDAIDNFEQLTNENDSIGQHALYLLGDCYIRSGDLRKARVAFQQASMMEYDDFVQENALFNFAKTSSELQIYNAAIQATQDFLNRYPDSENAEEAKELLTNMFLNTRNYREAISVIESMRNIPPSVREAYQKVCYYRGIELYNDKRFADANTHFDKSLRYPIDASIQAQTYFWKGEIALSDRDYPAAVGHYRKFKDLARVARQLPLVSSNATADYGIGYAYFATEDYRNAVRSFTDAVAGLKRMPNSPEAQRLRTDTYADALLRVGDCYFMLNEHNKALEAYKEIVDGKLKGLDYALFQQGMLYGVKQDIANKRQSMDQLVRNHPTSFYYDDALFQLASAYLLERNNNESIRYFERLINEQKQSPYVVQALLKVALIYYNTQQDQKALNYYTRVANDYPGTPEAKEALAQVKRISVEMGDPQIYIGLAGANVSEQDTLLYRVAENAYFREEYAKAKTEFSNYLRQFPNGYFSLLAHYYRGDCYYRDKEFSEALPDYEAVLGKPNNSTYQEVAYLRAAKINHYILNNASQAFNYYEPLLPLASTPQTRFETLQALMNLGYQIRQFGKASQYAQQMLKEPQAGQDDILNAHYYLGKIAYTQRDRTEAMTQFTRVKELTTNEKGVEARYYIALIHFERNDLRLSEAQCDDIIKNYPGYDLWLVKSLILVSDIYVQQKEYFQAKSTLESIVGSYNGDPAVLAEAEEKLAKVNELMANESRISNPNEAPFNQFDDPSNDR